MSPPDSGASFNVDTEIPPLSQCPKFQAANGFMRHRYFAQLDGNCAMHEDASNKDSKVDSILHSPFCPYHDSGFFRPQNVSSVLSICLALFGPKLLCGSYNPRSSYETPVFPIDPLCSSKGHTHEWKDGINLQFILNDVTFFEIRDAVLGYMGSLNLPSNELHTANISSDALNLPFNWPIYFYNSTKLVQFLCPKRSLPLQRIQRIVTLSKTFNPPSYELWLLFFNQFMLGMDFLKEENALAFVSFFYFFETPPLDLMIKFCNLILGAEPQFRRAMANAIMQFEEGYSREHGSKVLTKLVKSVNEYITKACEFFDLTNSKITDAVKALSLFDEINSKYNLIPIASFYNTTVNETLNIRQDFPRWKSKEGFAYCAHPYILNTATKSLILKVENMVQMRHELQSAFFKSMFIGPQSPYLELTVRRDRLIRDTIFQLQGKSTHDLRKQLRVRFIDEPGVDEGGVQKEFFHLIMKNIFKEDYGMFTVTNGVRWFRYNCAFDTGVLEEYELVGKLIGLAIYNAVYLDLHFPTLLYKKLTNEPLYLKDMKEINVDLARGLEQLALFEGNVKDTYMHCFAIDIEMVDGELNTVELCPNGKEKMLTNENRDEYIQLCLEYYLHTSIQEPFEAFRRGFELVTNSSSIRLFKAEELFQLLVGEGVLDFHALELKTQYDGGYTPQTPIIIEFWNLVHQMSLEDQTKLLFFVTGSVRAPIGGLSQLTFIISRNGPDSNRLPTSHTCFNVLLLPEYSDAEKMKRLLFLAMENLEGFGLF